MGGHFCNGLNLPSLTSECTCNSINTKHKKPKPEIHMFPFAAHMSAVKHSSTMQSKKQTTKRRAEELQEALHNSLCATFTQTARAKKARHYTQAQTFQQLEAILFATAAAANCHSTPLQ